MHFKERESLLLDVFRKLLIPYLKKSPYLITGGIASNSYMERDFRRFSDDIDIIVQDERVYKRIGELFKELGYKVNEIFIEEFNIKGISIELPGELRIYLFKVSGDLFYNKKTLEAYGIETKEFFNVITPYGLLKSKLSFMLWKGRGGEIAKDIYDILNSEILYEMILSMEDIPDEVYSLFYFAKRFPGLLLRVIKPYKRDLSSLENRISERAEKILEKFKGKRVSHKKVLEAMLYCSRYSFIRKLSKILGTRPSSKEIWSKLEDLLDEEVCRRIVEGSYDVKAWEKNFLEVVKKRVKP